MTVTKNFVNEFESALPISRETVTRLVFAKNKYNEAIKQKDSSMQLYWQGVVECLDGSIWGKDNAIE